MSKTQQAIDALIAQQREAEDFGYVWDEISQLVDHARSECDEIEDALLSGNKDEIADEIGDLVRAAVTLCFLVDVDLAEILEKGNLKFQTRFNAVRALAANEGITTLKGLPFEEKLAYWKRAKQQITQTM